MKNRIKRWDNLRSIEILRYIVEELTLTINGIEYLVENGAMMVYPIDKYDKYTQLIDRELESDPEIEWGRALGEEEW